MQEGCCRATRKSRGIALVQFAEPAGAAAAAAALDGAIFQGRLLHVLPARAPPAKAAAQACLGVGFSVGLTALDGVIFQGCLLHVLPACAPPAKAAAQACLRGPGSGLRVLGACAAG